MLYEVITERRHPWSATAGSGSKFSKAPYGSFMNGADGPNLVRSGLENSMCEAYRQICGIGCSRDDVPDLRTAACILETGRVARYYPLNQLILGVL